MGKESLPLAALALAMGWSLGACNTIPEPKHEHWDFPKGVYSGEPDRPYEKVGPVRAKVNYPSLSFEKQDSEESLCRNYFNKAASVLLRMAQERGGDAVIHVRAVTFTMDGKSQTHARAECVDDGSEGQVLAQGIAIRWKDARNAPAGPGAQGDDDGLDPRFSVGPAPRPARTGRRSR